MPADVRAAARVGALVALLVFAVLVCEAMPSGLFRRGPFTSDFFDAQAQAILDGHLDVDPQVAGIEGFVHDGRTHLYFGLVPAVLRLPVVAMTDRFDGRLTQLSMLIALAVATWAAARLAWRARRWRRGDGPPGRWEPWTVGGFTAAVGLASPLLFLAARPVVYHETELWGAATTLVALEALLHWWERPGGRALAVASLAALAACNTRASVGGGAVAALAITGALALVVKRVSWRFAPAVVLATLAPLLVYAAVNQARFGEPFSVPFRDQVLSSFDPARQATLEATGGSLFGPEFAPTALVTYVRPDGVALQRLFPWITFRETTDVIGDAQFDTVDRSASLPVVAPSLVLLTAVGVGALLRRGWRDPWLTATLGAAAGLVSTVTIAFVANRYLADATPALVLPAALGTWVVADWMRGWGRWRRVASVGVLVGLSAVGLAVSTALAIQSQRLFILPRHEARLDLVTLQYDLHDQLFGGSPPGVRQAGDVGTPGPRGEVVILDRCRGLYWSDGTRWWPLELSGIDGLVATRPLDSGHTVLLEAPTWRLLADAIGDDVQLRYEHDDGTVRVGGPVSRDDVDGAPLTVQMDR
ncbi:MAG: hypothetical protein ACRDZU_14365, partial [Acidimicrobiales bacterium]